MAYDVSRIRKLDDDLSRVRSAYGNDANVNMFSLKIHHGGVFVGFPERRYVNGQEAYIDLIDIDTFSVLELSSFMKELGYTHGRPMFYHFRVPNNDQDYGLKALACDEDVITLSKHVGEHKLINVYIEHDLTRLNINFTSLPVAELDNDFDPFLGLDDIRGNHKHRKSDGRLCNEKLISCSSHSAINNEAKDVDKHVEVIDNDSFDSSKSDEGDDIRKRKLKECKCEHVLAEDTSWRRVCWVSLEELGYTHGRPMFYHFRVPNNDQDYGLKALACDEDVITLSKHVGEHKLINVYIEHDLTRLNINFTSLPVAELDNDFDPFLGLDDIIGNQNLGKVMDDCVTRKTDKGKEKMVDDCVTTEANKGNKIVVDDGENSNDSDDSQDGDFMVDKENMVDEVEVDMQNYYLNINPQVEFPGCSSHSAINNEAKDVDKHVEVIDNDSFDSSESDEGDDIRKRKLKELRKNNTCDDNLNESTKSEGYFFRTIPVFSNGPNDGGPSNIGCSSIVPINIGCSSIEPINTGAKPSSKKQKKEGTGRVFKDKPQGNQCPWILHVSKLKEDETWVVKTFNDVHKCLQQRNVKAATAGFLSQQIIDQVEVNPEIPVKAIKISDYREQYKVLRNYCLELSHKNPGTTVRIEVEPEEDRNVETRVFKRIYICLGPLKDGFRAGMRDLLGLDGAFMKGPFPGKSFPGQVLAAIGLDSNNGIYPVAYAIVEAKNKDSWTWFLECLGEDLNLGPMLNFTFITYRQKVRQDFSLARRDISLATEKLHRSIKAAIKEEVDHEEQFDFLGVQLNQRIPNRTVKARKVKARLGYHHPSVARGNIRVLGLNVQRVRQHPPRLVYQVCYWPILHYKGNQRQIWDPGITWLKISKDHLEDKVFLRRVKISHWRVEISHWATEKLHRSIKEAIKEEVDHEENCPSREGMEGKSFEEGLAEITKTLKRLQSTLLFHQTKLKESFRQARQDFSLARRDISLATEKLHRSIKAAIKEEVDHEELFDFLGVQLNQRIPNRTVKARKVKARLFWRKFIVTIDRTRRPKSIQSVVMLRLGHHHPSVARGNIRVLGLNVQMVRQQLPRLVYQVFYWLISHYKGNQRQIWDLGIPWLKISKEHLEDKGRQDFSLARRDISLATEKLHRSIKAAIKEEVDHEEQFDFLGVQLNQRIPNRTVKAKKVKAMLFWRKFIVTIDRTRRLKSIQSVVMLRLGHHHPSVARGNIRVLGLNVQRARQDFSLARRDISLATEKLHRSIIAAIKEEVDHEEQFDFLGVQLNQLIPNRTVKARKVKAF
ncbi:hypothetical protein Tco_1476297 [Tanacetum coccineum]